MRCLMPILDESAESRIYNIRPEDGAHCLLIIETDPDTADLGYPGGEELAFVVGESDSVIDDAIEKEVVLLKAGQTAAFTSTCTEDSLEQIEIKLTLNSFHNRPPIGNLTEIEKLEIAKHHKSKGIELFKHGLFEYAFRRFSKALKFLILLLPQMESSLSLAQETNELRVHCYSNMALCQLKFGKYDFVKQNCVKALAIDPKHVKSWYRKAEACFRQRNWSDCEKAAQQGLNIEPHNKSLKQLLEQAKNEINKALA